MHTPRIRSSPRAAAGARSGRPWVACISPKPYARAALGPWNVASTPRRLVAARASSLESGSQDGDDAAEARDVTSASGVLYPWDPWLQAWSTLATVAAAATGFVIPLEVALGGGAHA